MTAAFVILSKVFAVVCGLNSTAACCLAHFRPIETSEIEAKKNERWSHNNHFLPAGTFLEVRSLITLLVAVLKAILMLLSLPNVQKFYVANRTTPFAKVEKTKDKISRPILK